MGWSDPHPTVHGDIDGRPDLAPEAMDARARTGPTESASQRTPQQQQHHPAWPLAKIAVLRQVERKMTP